MHGKSVKQLKNIIFKTLTLDEMNTHVPNRRCFSLTRRRDAIRGTSGGVMLVLDTRKKWLRNECCSVNDVKRSHKYK